MDRRLGGLLVVLVVVSAAAVSLGAVACGSPGRPSVSVVTGQPATPARGAALSFYSQPVTLTVTSGLTSTGEAPAAMLEVATDTVFTAVVSSKPVPSAINGQSTVTLDLLAPATTYYWRVKTTADGASVESAPSSFTIGPRLVIQAPVPVEPLADSFPHKRPTFTAMNATHTGPVASLTYTFELSNDAGFTALLASSTVPEGAEQTSFKVGTDLTPGTTYFWRARASDASTGVVGDYSSPQAFTVVFPDDGSYRYTLIVRAPSWCLTHFSGGGPCSPSTEWPQSDFGFDGQLVVDGDTLRYDLAPVYGPLVNEGPFRLVIQRTGHLLAGRISGTTAYGTPGNSFTMSGTVSGEADNRGRFDGGFDGRMTLWRFGFPCDRTTSCSTSGFAWTLLPR